MYPVFHVIIEAVTSRGIVVVQERFPGFAGTKRKPMTLIDAVDRAKAALKEETGASPDKIISLHAYTSHENVIHFGDDQ